MKRLLKITSLLLAAFGAFSYAIASYPILQEVYESPSGRIRIVHSHTMTPFSMPGQGCDGLGKIQLKTSDGQLLYDSGIQEDLKCMPAHIFFSDKVLIAGTQSIEDVFLNSAGITVSQIAESEFKLILAVDDFGARQRLMSVALNPKFGLTNSFFLETAADLIEQETPIRLSDAATIAERFEMAKNDKRIQKLFSQFVASEDPYISAQFFEKLYGNLPLHVYLKNLRKQYFEGNTKENLYTGLAVLRLLRRLPDSEKKKLLIPYTESTDSEVADFASNTLKGLAEEADQYQ